MIQILKETQHWTLESNTLSRIRMLITGISDMKTVWYRLAIAM